MELDCNGIADNDATQADATVLITTLESLYITVRDSLPNVKQVAIAMNHHSANVGVLLTLRR